MIQITTQTVDTWKKRITKPNLKGSTYFCQQSATVWVSASVDHQEICKKILGTPNKDIGLDSYIAWNDVQATDLVEILYAIESV
jgi:hypothetical protein